MQQEGDGDGDGEKETTGKKNVRSSKKDAFDRFNDTKQRPVSHLYANSH